MGYLTAFALDRSRITLLALLAIALFGTVMYLSFPSREDPAIVVRNAQITTRFPGMSAERIEQLITSRIEEKIREIPEIKTIDSTSKPGVSIVTVTVYDRYFNIKPIWQALRNKVADVTPSLPTGTQNPVVNDDYGNVAVATVMLTSDGFTLREWRDAARRVRDEIYTVPGIRKVDLMGLPEERIYLEINSTRIAEYGLSPQSLVDALQRQNIILPGGRLISGGTELIIQPSGNFETVDAIRRTVIALPNSKQVAYLRDIVNVRRTTLDPPSNMVLHNGKRAIAIAVSMLDGENIVAFGKRLQARLGASENALPLGFALSFATYQPDRVDAAISDFAGNLYQTVAIVLVVVVLFLGMRAGLIVGSIVPLTMLLVIILMRLFEIDLHRVSIASLIIALGMLVDNGIVVAEDIKRRLGLGADRRAACVEAAGSLAVPLLSSSLTTVLAFSPLLLASNATGEFLGSLALVVTITLLSSWFLSLTAIPALSYALMRAPSEAEQAAEEQRHGRGLYLIYRRFLRAVVAYRGAFLLLMVAAFIGALFLFRFVPVQFMPESDRNQFQVTIDLPVGSTSTETERVVRQLTGWLNDRKLNPAVRSHVAYIGFGGPRFFLAIAPIDPDPNRAYLLVTTRTPADVAPMMAKVHRFVASQLPDARASVKPLFLGAKEPNIVEYRLSGPDTAVLRRSAEQLIAGIRPIGAFSTLQQNWDNKILTVLIKVDQARARRAGTTSEDIATSLNNFFSGSKVSDYREGDLSIPIMLRGERRQRETLDRLPTLPVIASNRGTVVPLIQIANIDARWDEARIVRRNMARTITVTARHATLNATALHARIAPALGKLEQGLPPGYRIELGGELESSGEANAALLENMPVAMLAIFILLVWQFNSFRRTAIVGLTIPLSLIGAVLGLLALNASFGFTTLLGLLSLAGIIINNAIVLIDQFDHEAAEGGMTLEAIEAACTKRLRPILVSSLTTILGLLPLLLFGGDLWFGMAAVIMFGLLVGTVLTLAVVPALFTILFGVPKPGGASKHGPIARFLARVGNRHGVAGT